MRVRAEFTHLIELKRVLAAAPPVIGVGVSAFQRTGLGYLLPDYRILALLETNDLPAIRRVMPVTTVAKELGRPPWPEKLNTSSILSLPQVKKFVRRQRPLNLFVYKAATPLDPIIAGLGAKLLSAPGYIRKPLEDKKVFREAAARAGLAIPPGENLPLSRLTEAEWDRLKLSYGQRLVFQLTDYSTGGGQGTFFIDNQSDWNNFWEFCRSQDRKKELKFVNVCRRLAGRAASITGCATRHGVIAGVLQTQIMDQPELAGFRGRSGVWLGHDWNVSFSPQAQAAAEALCYTWGEYIYQKGYKGIFGLDVVVDDDDTVTAIECNSRYTGAFPVYTMLQLFRGETPLDVWHLLEWLGMDYDLDLEEARQVSRRPKAGSHIILHNREAGPVRVTGELKAGVYRLDFRRTPTYLGGGFSLLDIKNDDEFILCDRVPDRGQTVKPGERMGKLMFKRRIVDDSGRLLPEIRTAVEKMYAGAKIVSSPNFG